RACARAGERRGGAAETVEMVSEILRIEKAGFRTDVQQLCGGHDGNAPPAALPAHRAHPLTSTPEHCAPRACGRTIGSAMQQSAVAEPAALLVREHELERIRAALEDTGRQGGRRLVVEAPAGMGRSRLLERARAQASDLGLHVLAARA